MNNQTTALFLIKLCTLATLFYFNITSSVAEPINLIEEKAKYQANTQFQAEQNTELLYKDRYRIELLIFAYVNSGEEKSELWRNLQRPDFEEFSPAYIHKQQEEPLATTSADVPQDAETETNRLLYNFIEFNYEDEENPSEFLSILRKMKINGHYRTLQHLIWEQIIPEQQQSPLFYIEGGNYYPGIDDFTKHPEIFTESENQTEQIPQTENDGDLIKNNIGIPELAGTLHIYRSRYLHVKPDLWFTDFALNDAGTCPVTEHTTELIDSNLIKPVTYTPLTNYHINQHRRLKSGELHYIDHPMFGLLIKFTKLETPEAESTEAIPISVPDDAE